MAARLTPAGIADYAVDQNGNIDVDIAYIRFGRGTLSDSEVDALGPTADVTRLTPNNVEGHLVAPSATVVTYIYIQGESPNQVIVFRDGSSFAYTATEYGIFNSQDQMIAHENFTVTKRAGFPLFFTCRIIPTDPITGTISVNLVTDAVMPASTTRAGVAQFATEADAVALVSNRAITPALLPAAITRANVSRLRPQFFTADGRYTASPNAVVIVKGGDGGNSGTTFRDTTQNSLKIIVPPQTGEIASLGFTGISTANPLRIDVGTAGGNGSNSGTAGAAGLPNGVAGQRGFGGNSGAGGSGGTTTVRLGGRTLTARGGAGGSIVGFRDNADTIAARGGVDTARTPDNGWALVLPY